MISAIWAGKLTIFRGFVIAAVIISISFISTKVFAEDPTPSWLDAEPTLLEDVELRQEQGTYHKCTKQYVTIDGTLGQKSSCVVNGKNMLIEHDMTSIGIGNDHKQYKINGLGPGNITSTKKNLIPSTDMLVTRSGYTGYTYSGRLSVESNLINSLSPTTGSNFAREYNYQYNPDFLLSDGNGPLNVGRGFNHSENGRWLVVELMNIGLARIDTQNNYKTELFSDFAPAYYMGSNPHMMFAISNDGKHVAVSDSGTNFFIYEIGDACTKPINPTQPFSKIGYQECPKKDLGNDISFGQYQYPPLELEFDDSGYDIKYTAYAQSYSLDCARPDPDIPCNIWHTIRAGGYLPSPLDYLALGDSYSSGEGDIEKKPDGTTYYTPISDFNGGCHISERSYPFRLSTWMNIGSNKMQTVACAGAKVDDMRLQGDEYTGQNGRLNNLSPQELIETKQNALDRFLPGRTEQIQFVKKYHPKSITLTGGGNDVDFGGKLKICASHRDICRWASGQGSSMLGYEIQNEFYELKNFYKELKAASPKTKIYVVGYPSFINPSALRHCAYGDGYLAAEEKEMIDESLKFMNDTIQLAAQAAGVVYTDTEGSLNGGRICDFGGEYVTGQIDIRFSQDEYDRSQTFHPNASGHQKMSETIQDQLQSYTLLTYPYTQTEDQSAGAPSPSDYFSDAMNTYYDEKGAKHETITNKSMTKGQPYNLDVDRYTFQSQETVTATIYSDPINLDSYTTDTEGSINSTITISDNVPAGYHTLELKGSTFSGEPLTVEQTILVKGTDPNDIDENGAPDNEQTCGPFAPWSNIDEDFDGVDDACDGFTNKPRPIYRLRHGDPMRMYQGSVEDEDYLYLERNIYAKVVTGVSGDDDPDGNGYAVIAATQAAMPSGHFARLQTDTSAIPNSVYISFRTNEDGCVQHRPNDASQVVPSSGYRTFAQHTANTNTCRDESASDDLDSNDQPDDTQPLYIGRNGDPSKGETSTKLYLFRSTRAAEAQLGISDYAPFSAGAPNPAAADDSTDYREHWSLLAHTKSNPALPVTFKKVHMIGATPYVLATTNTGKLCQAYRPENTATIKQSTQSATKLVFDLSRTLSAQIGGWCG